MEEKTPQEQIAERMGELPQDVQNAVLSAETGKHIEDIGAKHSLHVDQIGTLGDLTMLVMLGFADASNFDTQIQTGLNISLDDAQNIASEIANQIFMPIRQSMKNFLEKKASVEVKPSEALTTPAAPTPPLTPPAPAPTLIAMPTAEKMLTEKTAVVIPPSAQPTAPAAAPTPAATPAPQPNPAAPAAPIYKKDPYREPLE